MEAVQLSGLVWPIADGNMLCTCEHCYFQSLPLFFMSLEPQGQKLSSAMLPLHLSAHCSSDVRPGKAQVVAQRVSIPNLCRPLCPSTAAIGCS